MSLTNLLSLHRSASNQRRTGKARRRHARGSSTRRFSYAPRFESLERRDMLSAISVVNTADSGPGSLRDAIAAANAAPGADVIDFAPTVRGTIALTSGELEITDDLTINGRGEHQLKVSGSGQSRVFSLVDSTVEIDRLTIADGFVNGVQPQGGGVLVDGSSALSLHHVIVADNQVNANQSSEDATAQGGGVFVVSGGVLDVVHGTFTDNQATTNRFSTGGAIYNDGGTVTIDLSTFTGNQSRTNELAESGDFDRFCHTGTADDAVCSSGGGAITTNFSTTTVTRSSFVGNTVTGSALFPNRQTDGGGAMNSSFGGTITVDQSYFSGNSVSSVGLANGGAIVHIVPLFPGTGLTVTDSTFFANQASGVEANGGAIAYIFGISGELTVEGSRFIDNVATASVLARGGAISHQGAGTAHIVGSHLTGNSVHSDGLEFPGITTGAFGGAIASWSGATTIVEASSIVGNQASGLADAVAQGGGLYNDAVSSFTLTHSNVNANRAVGDPSDGIGGGIYNQEGGAFKIDKQSNVKGNKASTSNDNIFGDLTLLDALLLDALLSA